MDGGQPSRPALLAAAGPQLAPIVELCLNAANETIRHLHGHTALAAHAVLLMAASRAAQAPGPPILAVLEACGLRLEEAVRELGPAAAALEAPLASVLGGSSPLAQRLQLRELQQAYVLLTLLMKKARDLFREYFILPADSRDPGSALGFFWQLFCTARVALLPPQADLVTSFALLLACTHFMLRHVPAQHQRGSGSGGGAQQAQQQVQQQAQQAQQQQQAQHGSVAVADELLVSVAASHSAADHISTVRELAGLLDQLARQVLLPAVVAAAGQAAQQPNGGAHGGHQEDSQAMHFLIIPGLFDAAGQPDPAALQALQQRQQQLAGPVDIDATAFLTAASHGTPGQPTPGRTAAGPPTAVPPAHGSAPAAVAAAAAAEAHLASAAALLGGGADEEQAAGQAAEAMALDEASPAVAKVAPEPALPPSQPSQHEQQGQQNGQQPQEQRQEQNGQRQQQEQPSQQQEEAHESPRSPAKRPFSAEQEEEPGGKAVRGSDAGYHTPSPAKRQRPVQPLQPHPTPISAALSSTAWLRGVVAGQPAGPSEAMQALIRSAGLSDDAKARLVGAAQAMAAAVFPDPAGQLEGPLAALELSTVAARRAEGLKLYWRALEGLVAAEAARPDASPGSGASLLAAPAFHRCVAACAFELVAAAYRVGTLAFPAVLERLRLPAFELCKVLEPFVQQVPSLPRDLKRHLLSVEEQCLECLAWQPGSSLFTSMIAAVGMPPGSAGGSGGMKSATASGGGGGAPAVKQDINNSGQVAAAPAGAAPQTQQLAPQQQQQQQQQQLQQQVRAGSPARSKADSSERAAADGTAQQQQGPEDAAGTADAAGAADALSADDDMADGRGSQAPVAGATHCAEGKLPLFLGHEPPAAPAAAAGGGEQQAQQAAAAAAGRHAAEIARGDRGSRAAVAEFLRRVLKLCAIRLADLLSRLDCHPADPQLLLAEAYTLAQHVCFEQSWLLYGRHLDQVLLCCLYSICKVHHLGQASFKAIIAAYKQQPQARPDTFKSVSMTPRERTSLHSMGGPPHADVIAFYNQVFLPHTKPFLLRLAESRSLLAQPPASVLPYLLATHGQQQQAQLPDAATPPPPPPMLLRGMQPASLQHTPFRPAGLTGGGAWPSPAPPPLYPNVRGLLGTPTRGSSGTAARTLQLRSPGAWRISRGQMTPILPSPQLASMTPGFSPGGLHPGFLHGAPPLSMAAIHSMFGLPSGSAAPVAPAPTLPALPSKAAELAAVPPALPPAPQPLVSDVAVQAMFASAEAAAAAAAAGAAGAAVEPAEQPPATAVLDAADIEELHQLSALPSESLPLLAAAAAVAEEIEQREREVAEAFSRRAAQLAGAALVPPLPAAPVAPSQPEQAEAEAEPPQPLQPAPQQQQQPMLSPARHARRVLSLQPAAPPVQ